MKPIFVVEYNYGGLAEADHDWRPISWVKRSPGYNSRMALGTEEDALLLVKRWFGEYNDRVRVVRYVRE